MGQFSWFVMLGAAWLPLAGCGGKSVSDGDAGGGAGQATAGGSSGSSARGGAPSGSGGSSNAGAGNRAGSSSTAGTGTAGTGTAGWGGSGTAGTSATAGSGGSATPSRCEQPLESGSCNAYFPSYGFNATNSYCQRFIYGGCGGNDNRFESLADCEAECGGSNEAGCPELMPPEGSSCTLADRTCHYSNEGCQCAPTATGCLTIDPFCPALPVDEARSRRWDPQRSEGVVMRYTYACQCTNGAWVCPTLTGGP